MTIYAGVDVGVESTKLVIINKAEVLFSSAIVTEEEGGVASQRALDEALEKLKLSLADLSYIVSTGIGRHTVHFANEPRTEQMCHARGAYWLFSSARTVLDVGAGGSRAMKLNEQGKLVDFVTSSKCASGTGICLETMSKILEVPLEKMGQIAVETNRRAMISNICAVFMESEVVGSIGRGVPRDEIIAGVHDAVSDRLVEVINRVGVEDDVVMTGGVAKNAGIVSGVEKRIARVMKVPQNPQIVGALGAALIASDRSEQS